MKPASILLLSLLTIFVSCKKDDTSKKSKRDMLTAYDWKRVAMISNGVITYTAPCEEDDRVRFWESGQYNYTVGNVLCSQFQTGQTLYWSLSTDENTLTLGTSNYTFNVSSDSLTFTGNGYSFVHVAVK